MSSGWVNQLSGSAGVNLRDYQHASRLYLRSTPDRIYEFSPKAGWIYYVRININADIAKAITDTVAYIEFNRWYGRYKGFIGLLSKQVDLPKFTIDTEIMNQYNRKHIIQKKINYSPISITFHDDMANLSTNFWKSYYTYYYGDSNDTGRVSITQASTVPKYSDNKYNDFISNSNKFGLSNGQSIPFIESIDIFQLNQKKYTAFKLVKPLIKDWSHESLDQSAGSKIAASKMIIEYETMIYDTNPDNRVISQSGFNSPEHYDTAFSTIGIGGQGNPTVVDQNGSVSGITDIRGSLNNPGNSDLDRINSETIAAAGSRLPDSIFIPPNSNVKFFSLLLKTSGPNILSSQSLNESQSTNPAGISVPAGSQPSNATQATQVELPSYSEKIGVGPII